LPWQLARHLPHNAFALRAFAKSLHTAHEVTRTAPFRRLEMQSHLDAAGFPSTFKSLDDLYNKLMSPPAKVSNPPANGTARKTPGGPKVKKLTDMACDATQARRGEGDVAEPLSNFLDLVPDGVRKRAQVGAPEVPKKRRLTLRPSVLCIEDSSCFVIWEPNER
jgi:hypothetical protein